MRSAPSPPWAAAPIASTNGEPSDDAYHGSFRIDNTGPTIVTHTPSVRYEGVLSGVTLESSEALLESSLTPGDVTLAGPGGTIAISGIQQVDPTHWRIGFAAQKTPGNYHFQIGPDVTDLVGNKMDQNANGIFGEPADAYAFDLELALPNLVAVAPDVPATVSEGSDLLVAWTALDNGRGTAVAPWSDRVVLSRDPYYGSYDDIVLGTQTHQANLASGESRDAQLLGKVPWGLEGQYTVFIKLDSGNAVLEESDSDNLYSTTIQILDAQPPADLMVDVVIVPTTGGTGQPIPVSWRVTNYGTAETAVSAWSDRVYLSADEVFGNDIVLGTFAHSGSLASGGSYAEIRDVRLPEDLAAGQYTVFVKTDVTNQVIEPTGEGNNVGQGLGRIDVSLSPVADLKVTSVSGPAEANVGETIRVDWNAHNAGGATAAGPWTDRVYLSPDGTTSGAIPLGSFVYDG